MPPIRRLPAGVDPTTQPKQFPTGMGTGRIFLIASACLVAAGICLFVVVPAAYNQVNPPTPTQAATGTSAATVSTTPSPSPSATQRPDSPAAENAEPAVQTVEVEVTRQVEVPGPTQIVNQSHTVYVDRDVPGPTQIVTQIVQVPVTQILQVPVTQIVVQTAVWIITATPQSATATASPMPSPTSTPSATPTQTPMPTETETATP